MSHPPGAHVQPSTRVNVQLVAGAGHPVLGAYCEGHWLPVLGPTCYLLARRFADSTHGITSYTYGDLAFALGVSPTKIRDAVKRLRRFGPVEYEDRIIVMPDYWPDAPPPYDWAVHHAD